MGSLRDDDGSAGLPDKARWCAVTGGRGFMARHLVAALLRSGEWNVRVTDLAPTIVLGPGENEGLLGDALGDGRAVYASVDVCNLDQLIKAAGEARGRAAADAGVPRPCGPRSSPARVPSLARASPPPRHAAPSDLSPPASPASPSLPQCGRRRLPLSRRWPPLLPPSPHRPPSGGSSPLSLRRAPSAPPTSRPAPAVAPPFLPTTSADRRPLPLFPSAAQPSAPARHPALRWWHVPRCGRRRQQRASASTALQDCATILASQLLCSVTEAAAMRAISPLLLCFLQWR